LKLEEEEQREREREGLDNKFTIGGKSRWLKRLGQQTYPLRTDITPKKSIPYVPHSPLHRHGYQSTSARSENS